MGISVYYLEDGDEVRVFLLLYETWKGEPPEHSKSASSFSEKFCYSFSAFWYHMILKSHSTFVQRNTNFALFLSSDMLLSADCHCRYLCVVHDGYFVLFQAIFVWIPFDIRKFISSFLRFSILFHSGRPCHFTLHSCIDIYTLSYLHIQYPTQKEGCSVCFAVCSWCYICNWVWEKRGLSSDWRLWWSRCSFWKEWQEEGKLYIFPTFFFLVYECNFQNLFYF